MARIVQLFTLVNGQIGYTIGSECHEKVIYA